MKPGTLVERIQEQTGLDVYDQAKQVLEELIRDLCDVLEVPNAENYKRMGYEMIAAYSKQSMNTGVITLVFASVLQDIMAKLELTQSSENVSMVRDSYSMLKLDDEDL